MNLTDELISRRELLRELEISDSSERRKRRGSHPWPPHLYIGSKVYYRRSAVNAFLQHQEAICRSGPTDVDQKSADEVTAQTPPPGGQEITEGVDPPEPQGRLSDVNASAGLAEVARNE